MAMTGAQIHATAIVDTTAQIGDGVVIGPYAVIGENVILGTGAKIGPHAVVEWARVGAGCEIFPGAYVGTAPQDLK